MIRGFPVSLADLGLILTRGIPARLLAEVRRELLRGSAGAGAAPWPARRVIEVMCDLGASPRGGVHPPNMAAVRSLRNRLMRDRVGVLWRGDEEYPVSRFQSFDEPHAWLFIKGDPARLTRPMVTVVGSRGAGSIYLKAAARLGRALTEAGMSVVSGLAPGADEAAHVGALAARPETAGGVAVPARGILAALATAPFPNYQRDLLTWVGIARPDEPFSAGLAIRRNHVMAALGGGVVLVASDTRGGSMHTVRRGLRAGRPVWAFEAGARTPAANAALIRAGFAQPLPLAAPAEAWAAEIQAGIRLAKRRKAPTLDQLDWLNV